MAVDKKSDYYTASESYVDMEGHSRRFTYIDHDVKTKISTTFKETNFQKEWRTLDSFVRCRTGKEFDDFLFSIGKTYNNINLGELRQLSEKLKDVLPKDLPIEKQETEKFSLKEYRANLIKEIQSIPASICPNEFAIFKDRGEGKSTIEWNSTMLNDPGMDLTKLGDLLRVLKNRYNK